MNKVIIFLISFFFLNISQSAMAIETPDYTVKMSHNNYEIRSLNASCGGHSHGKS